MYNIFLYYNEDTTHFIPQPGETKSASSCNVNHDRTTNLVRRSLSQVFLGKSDFQCVLKLIKKSIDVKSSFGPAHHINDTHQGMLDAWLDITQREEVRVRALPMAKYDSKLSGKAHEDLVQVMVLVALHSLQVPHRVQDHHGPKLPANDHKGRSNLRSKHHTPA
jgi:hypothetical protein